ncbi:MAG: sigma-70 family RNA polymerase sigma factor [Sandaracinaceae bacterium]|nr:sigma-70 family RNA polymerase sigma factor [Sandaracinaceae bacterium]
MSDTSRSEPERTERRELLLADLDRIDPDALLWWPPSSPDPARARLVRDALVACLTDRQRDVVTAYFFEGRSQSEIARSLGVRQQVVHKHIFGVRRRGRHVGGALKRLAAWLAPRLGR